MHAVLLLVSLIIAFCTSTSAQASDPTRASVHATLVDKDGEAIKLLAPAATDGSRTCQKYSVLAYQPIGHRPWCYADVHITTKNGGEIVWHISPQPSRWADRSIAAMSNAKKSDAYSVPGAFDYPAMADDVNGWAEFSVYPDSGMLTIWTDPIGQEAYIGHLDTAELLPGKRNEVRVVMDRMPLLHIYTDLSGTAGTQLVTEVAESPAKWVLPELNEDGMQPLGGGWILRPGTYTVNIDLIPDEMIVRMMVNSEVAPLPEDGKLVLRSGEEVTISIGPAVVTN